MKQRAERPSSVFPWHAARHAAATERGLLDPGQHFGAGVHDAVSAALASRHGFDFLWLSSFGLSAVRGLPDTGLLDAGAVVATARTVCSVSDLPLVVDLDSGYGGPFKLYSVVRDLAAIGVAAVCVEDNPLSKRCSLYSSFRRELASAEEHAERIHAAREATAGTPCAVVARTEALVAGLGVDEAMARLETYVDAGASAVFVQSISAAEELLRLSTRWASRTAFFTAPTRFPELTKSTLRDSLVTHCIFANQGLRAAYAAMDATFAALAGGDSAEGVESWIAPVDALAANVGADWVADFDTRVSHAGRQRAALRVINAPTAFG